jgi:hypothetical protein
MVTVSVEHCITGAMVFKFQKPSGVFGASVFGRHDFRKLLLLPSSGESHVTKPILLGRLERGTEIGSLAPQGQPRQRQVH